MNVGEVYKDMAKGYFDYSTKINIKFAQESTYLATGSNYFNLGDASKIKFEYYGNMDGIYLPSQSG
jgi:hypothetical protein